MLKPLNDRVVVQPEKKEVTGSGILLVESKEKPVIGTVIVGNSQVKKGDRVLFSRFGFDEVEIDKKLYYVVNSANILAIF